MAHTCIWQVHFAGPEPPGWITAGFVLVRVLMGAVVAALVLGKRRQTLHDRLARAEVVRGS